METSRADISRGGQAGCANAHVAFCRLWIRVASAPISPARRAHPIPAGNTKHPLYTNERSIDSRSRSTAIVYLPKHRSIGIARTREILRRSIVRPPRGFDKRAIVSLSVCQTRLRNAGSCPRFYRNQPCHASPSLRLGKRTTYARSCVAFVTP